MQLVIEKKEGDKESPKKKTRQFSALYLGHLSIPMLWDAGYHAKESRPNYIVVAGTTAALKPFLANFHTKGLRADLQPNNGRSSWSRERNWYRCLKSGGYELSWQRDSSNVNGVQIATLMQPTVFQVDPGMIDPKEIKFASIPPQAWCQAQAATLNDKDKSKLIAHTIRLKLLGDEVTEFGFPTPFNSQEDVFNILPQAVHFTHCLDKRTKRPLIAQLDFYLHLYLAALAKGIASYWNDHPWTWATHTWANDFTQRNAVALGFCSGAIVNCSHKQMDRFLETEVPRYLEMTS